MEEVKISFKIDNWFLTKLLCKEIENYQKITSFLLANLSALTSEPFHYWILFSYISI